MSKLTHAKKRLRKLSEHRHFSKAVLFILLFAGVAIFTILNSFASTPTTSFELEDATLAAGAIKVTDPNASKGEAVSFGSASVGQSQFRTSAVLTQNSLDPFGNATAVAAGKALLNASTYTVAQPIMGFGVLSPSSSKGVYDWSGLDKRIGPNGVTSGTSEVVLNANAVPGWMRNTPDFGNDASGKLYLEYAPLPEHYGDFADLVAAAVQHYPNIKAVNVWSEMKGFFDSSKNRWNYEGYTIMYNQIWDKVKAVRPDVKIGGPYPALTTSSKSGRSYNSTVLKGAWGWADQRDMDVITYWLQNKTGGDFINLDMRNHHTYDDLAQSIPPLVGPFDENDKFIATVAWIRSLSNTTYPGATALPVWFSEWYSRWDTPDPTKSIAAQTNQGNEIQRAAVMTDGLIKMVKGGAARAFMWGPQGEPNTNGWMHPLGLFTNTKIAGGGIATPFYASQKALNDHFPAGTALYSTDNNNTSVTVLASSSKLLMVNKTAVTQIAKIDGKDLTLTGYQVLLADR